MSGLFAIIMAIGCTGSPTGPQSTEGDVTDNGPSPTEPGTPGHVTDLIVTDSTGTGVTLSFTQVHDGAGNPADYAIRTHVGPMNWGAAEEVSQGTCAAPLQGTGIGSTMSCTIEGLLQDVAYTFQVAAFRGTFQAGAIYGELSNVVPDMGDEPEQAPRDGSRPNEPAGYGVIVSSGFPCVPSGSSCVDSGASYSDDWGNMSTVSDGGSSVLRTRFPAGQSPGSAPAILAAWDEMPSGDPTIMKEVYQSMHIRLVSGPGDGMYEFYSGTNKLGFWGTQTPAGVASDLVIRAFPDAVGTFTGEIEDSGLLGIVQQNNVSLSRWTDKRIVVDTWQHWEFQFILNDVGSSNGVLRWWIDGVLEMEITDMVYITDNEHGFWQYKWNPTWGGGSGHDDKSRTDYIDIDDLYISGIAK